MDGEGISIPVATTTTPSSPSHDPDFSPVGSPEIIDDVPPASDELQSSKTDILTEELRDRIMKQVEYYFSDENLQTDRFLMKHLTKDKEGFVPVAVIASFRKMKKLTRDRSLIVAALRESSLLVVSLDDKKVKRLHPLPSRDPELCTVLVENLPDDHSTENVQSIFGEAGKIMNITIHDPNTTKEPRKRRIEERLLCGKLHAVVEYEAIEAAEKAVATLNNEQDWRYGMRVKLLKRKGKHAQKKKVPDSEQPSNVQAPDLPVGEENHHSNEQHDDTPNEEIEEHLGKEKNGYKIRNRGRARRQKYQGSNGHGHGTSPLNHASEISKPPPGPRMPDGTRGFTMGRGRPLTSNQN